MVDNFDPPLAELTSVPLGQPRAQVGVQRVDVHGLDVVGGEGDVVLQAAARVLRVKVDCLADDVRHGWRHGVAVGQD